MDNEPFEDTLLLIMTNNKCPHSSPLHNLFVLNKIGKNIKNIQANNPEFGLHFLFLFSERLCCNVRYNTKILGFVFFIQDEESDDEPEDPEGFKVSYECALKNWFSGKN